LVTAYLFPFVLSYNRKQCAVFFSSTQQATGWRRLKVWGGSVIKNRRV